MRYSKIIPASLAITVLSVLSAAAQQAPPRLAYVQPLSLQSVQSVQEKLREAGVYSGRIDGIWGADSETALQNFQRERQLNVTGQLNQATAATLGSDPNWLLATQAVPPPPLPPASKLLAASVRAVQARLGDARLR